MARTVLQNIMQPVLRSNWVVRERNRSFPLPKELSCRLWQLLCRGGPPFNLSPLHLCRQKGCRAWLAGTRRRVGRCSMLGWLGQKVVDVVSYVWDLRGLVARAAIVTGLSRLACLAAKRGQAEQTMIYAERAARAIARRAI